MSFLAYLSYLRCINQYNFTHNNPELILLYLIFATICGVRWNVGVDYLSYLKNYDSLIQTGYSFQNMEIGFEYITKLFTSLNIHYSFYFAFLGFIQIYFIFKAIKNEPFLYPYIPLLIFLGPYFLSLTNGIRQMIVATAFVYAFNFIKNKNLIKYLLFICLAMFIHKSAIVLIPFYFILKFDIFKYKYVAFTLLFLSIFISQTDNSFINIINATYLLKVIGYDSYSENLDYFINNSSIKNFGPRTYCIIINLFFIILFSDKLKQFFKGTLFNICYTATILGGICSIMFMNANHIFLRPLSYLTMSNLFTTSYLLSYLLLKFNKNYISAIIFITVSTAYLPISIISDYGKEALDFTNFKYLFYN